MTTGGFRLVALIAILSMLLYLYMSIRTGQARARYEVKAPAMSGHPVFDRTFRVQMNTLEILPVYLASLFLFAIFVHDYIAAALGAIWIIGRYIYMEGYIEAAERRSAGYLIQGIAVLALLLGSMVGVLWGLIGLSPLIH